MNKNQVPIIDQAMDTPQFGWLCAVDKDNYPVSTRGYLFKYDIDNKVLKVIVSKSDSENSVLPSLSKGTNIAAVIANGITFNSIQYKGEFIRKTELTEEDQKNMDDNFDAVVEYLGQFGFSKELVEKFYTQEHQIFELAISEIFDQTPKQGTGNKL